MPQLGLGPRHRIMGLGQFLNVVRPGDHRVLEDLHRADLQHVQDDLRILRIILVPAVVQRLACAGEGDRGHQLQFEPGGPEMKRQHAVIVAGRLEPDPDRQAIFPQASRSGT